MPLEDANISRETDGFFNEEYCKWCYSEGEYTYQNINDLIEFCAKNMSNAEFPQEKVRSYMKERLPQLNYWKQYVIMGGDDKFEEFKTQLLTEINALEIEGMPKVKNLRMVAGKRVNFAYQLPNQKSVFFLEDDINYLGDELECEFGGECHFGIVAGMEFILVYTCEKEGMNPELVLYKKR